MRICLIVLCCWISISHAVTVAISCGAVGRQVELCREGVAIWEKRSGHKASVVSTPASSSERLALYQQLLAAKTADIDVFQIDVVWPGILATHFVDLAKPLTSQIKQHFPAIIANNTVNGRLIAMPWYTDAGVMYYRKDLLEKYQQPVPGSWTEMTRIAKHIMTEERKAGNDKMWGFTWQGRAYEGLTCNALEWVNSYGGGQIVESDGKISINNKQAVHAIAMAAKWVGDISPPGVLNYAEEDARGVFQSGYAVFMRNWPYVWALTQHEESPIRGKVGVSPVPKSEDGQHAATLGGWQLAVSKYSKHTDIAIDLVRYLTSEEEQKRRALAGSYNPTIPSLYQDKQVLTANPFFGKLVKTLNVAIARPSTVTGAKYNQVSAAFYNQVHQVLVGRQEADVALEQLARQLMRISKGGRW
ncbi:ABC transporter substrate-binding protein [Zooshikella harenae]|uniref:ABC transporter substrate-binding protein n=1 Tax=Zooshikella harenae TaxID=2827238 RepID=A0ABS5ZH46_9GAMM|nr:ABC transporter substrate-binding protein [Zooshikella harenae]MBU2713103.1 ABC transporter substrate-binding protein [Zooshikella harenae]